MNYDYNKSVRVWFKRIRKLNHFKRVKYSKYVNKQLNQLAIRCYERDFAIINLWPEVASLFLTSLTYAMERDSRQMLQCNLVRLIPNRMSLKLQ